MAYHSDLPESWIEIIEKDSVLKELWAGHSSEYEAVPDFLFGLLWDELERLKPIFALYGEAGMDMYDKIIELKALTEPCGDEASLNKYGGYFYVKEKGNEEMAQELVREYIQAMNDLYINEFEEEAILDEDAEITFVPAAERSRIMEELYEAWQDGEDMPENELADVMNDWFLFEMEFKDGCEELKSLLWEAVYNLQEDYKMSYYLMWSLADMPDVENPYLPYYKLWCMGYTARFAAKDQVLVC